MKELAKELAELSSSESLWKIGRCPTIEKRPPSHQISRRVRSHHQLITDWYLLLVLNARS
jgi:hypothetical protein